MRIYMSIALSGLVMCCIVGCAPRESPSSEQAQQQFSDQDQIEELIVDYQSLCLTLKSSNHPHCFFKKGAKSFSVDSTIGLKQIEFSAAGYYLCGVKDDGSVYCAGNNAENLIKNAPTKINTSTKGRALTVRGFYNGACAIDEQGFPICWGDINDELKNQWSKDVISIFSGPVGDACSIDNKNHPSCPSEFKNVDFEDNDIQVRKTPTAFKIAFITMQPGVQTNSLVYAIKEDKKLTWWGSRRKPDAWVIEAEKSAETFKFITTGNGLCGIKTDDTVACFGDDAKNGMPDASIKMNTLASYQKTFCGITDKGKLYCWGNTDDLPTIPKILLAQ